MDLPPLTVLKTRILTDNTGGELNLPIVWGPNGPLKQAMRFQVLYRGRSRAWHRKFCQALRLLLDYAAANSGVFSSSDELFEQFSVRLITGTVGRDGLDPSGLYWKKKSPSNANNLINLLTSFSAWLARKYGVPELNPLRDATKYEKVIAAAAWAYRKNRSFLGHTENTVEADAANLEVPNVPAQQTLKVGLAQKPRFPEELFPRLLFEGFCVKRGTAGLPLLNLRNICIALLQHGAGLRTSECLHLWWEDVQPHPFDPELVVVRIGHPSEGRTKWIGARGTVIQGSRRERLSMLGLVPRNDPGLGSIYAGWKNPTLDGEWYIQAHWSDPEYCRYFSLFWNAYTIQCANIDKHDNPWALINTSGPNIGKPYTLDAFRDSHYVAVERIGLNPRRVEGGRPHCHRHSYAYRLAEAGVPESVIKRAMHHSSIESQQVYTAPELEMTNREIAKGFERLATRTLLSVDEMRLKYEREMEFVSRLQQGLGYRR